MPWPNKITTAKGAWRVPFAIGAQRPAAAEFSRQTCMIIIYLFLLLAITCHADERFKDGMIPVAKFVLSSPTNGTYAPWRDAKNQTKYYAGETITLTNASFRYTTFSDVVGNHRDYSGKVSIFKDHIFLDHPGMPFPYRVAGLADGVPVLFTWEGYEQWKKTGKVFELNVLYLQKPNPQKSR
jgi:hypothetical protein